MDNLSQNIQQFFLDQYQGLDATATFLAFEPLGCIINPDEYKDPATNQFVPTKANEDIAEIVDRVPEISDVFIPTLNQVSAQYDTLVNGATFNEQAVQGQGAADYLALLGRLKSSALQTLADADRLSVVDASGKYFPATTVPSTWYDVQSPIWASKEFSADAPATPPATPPAPEPPDPLQKINLVWRNIMPDSVNPHLRQLAATGVGQPLLNLRGLVGTPPPPPAPGSEPIGVRKPLLATTVAMARPIRELAAPASATATVAPPPAPAALPVASRIGLLSPLLLANPLADAPPPRPSLALKADFTRLVLSDAAATTTKPVEASNFTMSFDYCVVQVHRAWLDMSLFNYARLWYSLAQTENCYSNGAKDGTNQGTLKAIPKAFIIIKNLKISASWSASDLHDAQNSVGLGFFNLLNSSVDGSNQLVNPALQIIGWLCEVPPKMPLVSDPQLAKPSPPTFYP